MGKTNKVMLIGNLGDKIKMHYFEGGNCLGRVSLATTETYKNKEGEKVTSTEWHNIVFRNKQAEVVEKYTDKGSKLYVEGRIKYREYEKDGEKKYMTEIVVNDFEFLSASNNTQQEQSGQNNNQAQTPDNTNNESENDLPF